MEKDIVRRVRQERMLPAFVADRLPRRSSLGKVLPKT